MFSGGIERDQYHEMGQQDEKHCMKVFFLFCLMQRTQMTLDQTNYKKGQK